MTFTLTKEPEHVPKLFAIYEFTNNKIITDMKGLRKKIDKKKVSQLAGEYKSDPNCWPELWISGEGLNSDEKIFFMILVRTNSASI